MLADASQESKTHAFNSTLLRDIALVVGFALALGASAQWQVFRPDSPVPHTLQTVVVLLCGFWLRPKLAMTAVCAYFVLGMATAGGLSKMPFFAAYRAGVSTATLGYIIGFLPAACGVSLLIRSMGKVTYPRIVAVGLLGTGVIFAFGLAWMALTVTSLDRAVTLGLVPFVGPAMLKLAVVSVIVYGGRLVSDSRGIR